MTIILIGFKSCGKSTVGKLLAEREQLDFVDLDDAIVELLAERFGVKWNCWEFYFSYGDQKFRELETDALIGLQQRQKMVLATGGGAPLRRENRTALADLGTVCYIKTSPDVLYERMRRKKMPAYLNEKPTLANLRRLWLYRNGVYQDLADLVVEADGLSPAGIADQIQAGLYG